MIDQNMIVLAVNRGRFEELVGEAPALGIDGDRLYELGWDQ